MRAIVVGAGIGGLAVALGLRRQGWDLEILEKAQGVRAAGAALSLAPNALRALEALGLLEAVREICVPVTGGEVMDRRGRVLKRVHLDPTAGRYPMVFLLRPRLHDVLRRRLGLPVRTGARVVSADPSGRVTLADGQQLEADLVVGADGIHSATRAGVLGNAPSRPLGIDAFRGLAVNNGSIPEGTACLVFGRGVEAGAAACGEGLVYWYVSAPGGRFADAAAATADLPFQVQQRIEGTPADRQRRDALVDRPPASRWHMGRIVLVGDAVHAMAPHAGQGAAHALSDAAALCEALGDGTVPMGSALAAYQETRKRSAERAVRHSRRNAMVSLIEAPLLCGMRDLAIRMMPSSAMVRAFGGSEAGRPHA